MYIHNTVHFFFKWKPQPLRIFWRISGDFCLQNGFYRVWKWESSSKSQQFSIVKISQKWFFMLFFLIPLPLSNPMKNSKSVLGVTKKSPRTRHKMRKVWTSGHSFQKRMNPFGDQIEKVWKCENCTKKIILSFFFKSNVLLFLGSFPTSKHLVRVKRYAEAGTFI